MKYLFIGTGVMAAVAFAVLTWGPLAKGLAPSQPVSAAVRKPAPIAPEPPPVPEPPRLPQPASYRQQPPQPLDLPNTSAGVRQGSTEAAEPMPVHRRPTGESGRRFRR